ncbi:putative F-box protein [Cardamine amara subsp. amara]|uniref:F-box protein n=1 Tax=Cardamine amara subsp. amara TaxID=228776 RepID=A0ABD1AKG8_CARAN
MKQREEKTEPTHRKRSRRQSSSTSNPTILCFPLDLILEILLRLPAKSIVRFRCVSKLWSSLTTDLYFRNLYETRSSIWPNLLMFFKKGVNLFVYSFPQHNQTSNDQPHSYSHHVDSYRMKYPKRCCFPFTESVHGLICFRIDSKPIIWNPTMRQFITLRKPEKSWKGIAVFLGYDPIEGKHKLVCMPRDNTCDECRILTLGSSQESWRKIKTNHKHQPTYRYYGQCINGVVYYQAYIDHNGKKNPAIMSFDVKSEKFDMIELPCGSFVKMLIPYHGKLACVSNNTMNKGVVDGITLWTLEDGEKHKWSSKQFLAPFAYRSMETDFKLAGITHAGEFIYVPSTFLNSFYILYFDPKNNNFRKVEFRGVADQVFRLGNELGEKRLNRLHTFPHHIQSLLSL